MPFERMSKYFKNICHPPISQGTIWNFLDGFALKSTPAYDLIAQKVSNEKVVGAYKTEIWINGKNGWF